jgi:radical SAM protein with 4Fe4S-binding SPASM domain
MQRKKGMMAQQVFEKIIHSIKEINLDKIHLFLHKEGEPLLDSNIIERIKYTKTHLKGLKELAINTNAMLLTEDKSNGLLNSGLDTIYFSVDGASAEVYNKIRVKLNYDVVEANLKKFFELRLQHGNRIRVIMQMLTNKDNFHEVDMFKKKWQHENCEFYIKQMHCYLDGTSSSFPQNKNKKQLHVCEDPFRVVVIYINGDIGICCWDYDNAYKIGNINDDSLIRLYNNEKFTYLREMQLKKDCGHIIPCNRCMRIYGNDVITRFDRD